jgi:hypothetical protein
MENRLRLEPIQAENIAEVEYNGTGLRNFLEAARIDLRWT